MTTRKLEKWRERVRALNPVQDPDELAEELLALPRQDRELVLAELPEELTGAVRAAMALLEPARPSGRRARRLRRSASAEEMPARSPAPWKLCTQCPFYGAEITWSGAAPVESMQTCPECGAALREAKPGEIMERLPPERRQALLDALAEMVVRHVMSENARRDGTLDSDGRR